MVRVTVLQTARLSHSEISGSRVICTYPKLIAAYHVLHRLCEPRHPPCALTYFISWTLLPFLVGSLWGLPIGSCAHTLAVLIDCLEIVLYLAIEFSFVSFDSPCSISKECSLQFSLCQYVKDLLPLPFVYDKTVGDVENNGFEPLTPCLQSRCSSQLSYSPGMCLGDACYLSVFWSLRLFVS